MTSPLGGHGIPAPARVTTYLLGGKDHLAADRAAADQLLTQAPEVLNAVREVRLFGHRAVQSLTQGGITQYVDLGCGLPLPGGMNVHEIAHQVNPLAKVAYVDRDPTVLTHARALLAVEARTTVVEADITCPANVLDHPLTRALLDPDVPVAVLCLNLGNLMDVATLAAGLPAGSLLVYGQLAATSTPTAHHLRQVALAAGLDWHIPPAAAIDHALGHHQPAAPGLGDLTAWRPDPHQRRLPDPAPHQRPLLDTARTGLAIAYGGVLHVGDESRNPQQEKEC